MTTSLLLLSLLSVAAPSSPFGPKARPYDVQRYALELKLAEDGSYKNTLTITLKAARPLSELELDAYGLSVEAAKVDGDAATFTTKDDAARQVGTLTLKLKKPAAAGKETTVVIAYSGKASAAQAGFFTVADTDDAKAPPYFFTHFEPTSAQRFFPCNDEPADKATFEVTAIVDGRYTVLSNGKKLKDEAFSADGRNLRRVQWSQEQPQSTYLFALAIGAFEAVEASPELPATVWVAKGRKDRAYVAVDVLKPLVNFEAAFVGTKFPFAKLDVVAVPRFAMSGMENTSLMFLRESALLVDVKNDQTSRTRITDVMAHEIAHQWFGDDVTAAWWNEIWLNEGFASYLGEAAVDDANNDDAVEVDRTASLIADYFTQDDGPQARALSAKIDAAPEDLFDEVAYVKGAQVLRMLESWVGKKEFQKALKAYLEKHALGAATSDDFFKAVFDSTKKEKELKPFKEAWLKKKGYPVIFPESSFAGGKLTLTIRQQPSHADEKGPFVFKLPIVVHRETEPAYTKEATILVDKPEVRISIGVPAVPSWVNWNKDFGALVKVNPPSVSEEQWVDAARHDPDPTWRLVAAWNLLGELGNPQMKEETRPTDAAMGALTDLLTKDASPWVRQHVLLRLADSRFKRLPKELGPLALSLAKRPEGLNEDPVGYIQVRRAAMEVLGRTDSEEGHRYLIEQLGNREIDINYLPGFAAGVARIGSSAALLTLRAAIQGQRSRGYPYYRRAAEALGRFSSADVLPVMREQFKINADDEELSLRILKGVFANSNLRNTREYGEFVRDLVLDLQLGRETMRSELLWSLTDVKTPAAKEALTAIADKAPFERLKAFAKQTLAINFPAPAADKANKGKK